MTSTVSLAFAMRTDFNACLEKAHAVLNPGALFQPNWHLGMLAWKCRLFAEGKIKRLAICLPPRHFKSTIGSVTLPAFILGRDPAVKIICASYGEDLAKDFSTQTRRFMMSQSYAEAFPHVQLEKATDMQLRTTKGGERYATTVGGSITGKGAEFIIVDDPMKFQDVDSEARRDDVSNWVSHLPTRLNNPNTGGILLIAQRLHQDDVIGRIADKGGWEIVNLPLVATQDESFERGPNFIYERKAGEYLHPARIDNRLAQQLASELGHSAFQAQYQQNPLPAGAGYFSLELIKRFKSTPKAFEHIFFSVDVATVANGGDYSVCTIWGYVGQNFYLLDVWRKPLSFPELRKSLIGLDKKWAPSVLIIEAIGSGEALYQDLSAELGSYVVAVQPKGNKAHRFEAVTLLMGKGRVWMPTNAPWLETLIKELQAFPQGKHDDQVDSISQMMFYWDKVVCRTRAICNPRARREIPTNYDVVATHRVNVYSIVGMPDLW